ncbi:DNA primase [Leptospirillum ferriphilum]|uniref:DNA primase n=2 Tax=Leptospirillum ferriphilum TaxID=178606 RepID=A0A059Y0Y8_9BACT|nr:DNA primase [Leptospirillum ferriphilum YSK]OOH70059.1 DNA primase [Leptospirillum ferriphilum]
MGLCPFHEEKTPSFHVDSSKQLFYCFGCQAGGDVFRFIEKFERKTFGEAVRFLGDQAGIPLPSGNGQDRRKACFQIFRETESIYRKSLSSSGAEQARKYLHETRRLKPVTMERFGLGWSMPGSLLKSMAPSRKKEAEEYGLLKQGPGGSREFFRNRIMVPIRIENGATVAFGGRVLPGNAQGPKYLNSPEHPFFRKKEILFGLDQAGPAIEKKRRVLVVEGYFDVMALSEAGVEAVVAPLGTALTQAHLIHLSRLADEVVVVFDGDRAGQTAIARLADRFVLDSRISIRAFSLPEGKDPDEWIREVGRDFFLESIEKAIPLADFVVDLFDIQLKSADATTRNHLLESFYDLAKRIPDPEAIDHFLSRGASVFRINKDLLAQGLFREESLSPREIPRQNSRETSSNRHLMERNLVLELVRLWTDSLDPHPSDRLSPGDFDFLSSGSLLTFVRELWKNGKTNPETVRDMILKEPLLAEVWMQLPLDRETRPRRLEDLVFRVSRMSKRERLSAALK